VVSQDFINDFIAAAKMEDAAEKGAPQAFPQRN
jgi:hypothetical protein